ncbi:MAG TPA: DUF1735 domain-containing protein [Candidatus Coprenecus stercorigallinarum]|nr:DUF1735 domain-containing protein [Candidatus Coprenecus stercorigallinarum]
MKSITKILLSIALPVVMLGTTSCLNDEPLVDWDQIKDHYVIELADSDHAQYSNNTQQGDEAEFMIIVNYTASYASEVTEPIEVQLEVDMDTIAKINESRIKRGEDPCSIFPAASYADLRLNSTIPAGEKRDTIYLNVDVDETFEVGRSYVLPLKIAGASDGYLISGNFNYLDLEINMAEPEVGIASAAKDTNAVRNVKPGDPVSFDIELAIDYPVTINQDVVADLLIDPERVVILSASLPDDSTKYELLSSADIPTYFTVDPAISIKEYVPAASAGEAGLTAEGDEGGDGEGDTSDQVKTTPVTIKTGTMKTAIKVTANTSAMQPGKRYVLPIEIHDIATDYFIAGSDNIIYLEVFMAPEETKE